MTEVVLSVKKDGLLMTQ